MSGFDWAKDLFAYLKKYAELGKICFDDVGRFDDCDYVWAAVGIVLGIVCVLALASVIDRRSFPVQLPKVQEFLN